MDLFFEVIPHDLIWAILLKIYKLKSLSNTKKRGPNYILEQFKNKKNLIVFKEERLF